MDLGAIADAARFSQLWSAINEYDGYHNIAASSYRELPTRRNVIQGLPTFDDFVNFEISEVCRHRGLIHTRGDGNQCLSVYSQRFETPLKGLLQWYLLEARLARQSTLLLIIQAILFLPWAFLNPSLVQNYEAPPY
eukprot:Protomagalhaensia_sp_Gyna_25__3329@NODE_300_length_4004_cov_227_496847_g232_i0_p3_GENE_NODE_300_length_4004_cov_227_496847_g232_i0NODE_300_length_4004_cov_227_496847_g232_i0_p3_ORF_typecomplete_len136_score22_35_NODE_300_length_4004_cov_227_496847_g232_i08621269